MIRIFAITLACTVIGLPLTLAATVATLDAVAGLDSAQGLYFTMVFGPVLWTGLYFLALWRGTPKGRRENTKATDE